MASVSLSWRERPPVECRGGALSIGNFDGVHRGHAALLAELRRQAEAVGGPAVALTFQPHPWQLLRPGQAPAALTTPEERVRLLHVAGAEQVVVLQVTGEFLQLTAEAFFKRVVLGHLEAKALVEGSNFRFGRGRGGDVQTLARLGEECGRRVVIVPPVLVGGEPVSSSRVRRALETGEVRQAAACLGRPYRLAGQVIVGQRRGRTLGYPTANLGQVRTLVPAEGVYAVRATAAAGTWAGALNIGPNPTFGEQQQKIEVHLIEFEGDLYGQTLALDFLERLRATRPFPGVQHLLEQLKVDVEQARAIAAGATG